MVAEYNHPITREQGACGLVVERSRKPGPWWDPHFLEESQGCVVGSVTLSGGNGFLCTPRAFAFCLLQMKIAPP